MKGVTFLVLGFLLILCSMPCVADDGISATIDTGNLLRLYCSNNNAQLKNGDWAWCMAYVHGVLDGYMMGVDRTTSLNHPKETNAEWRSRFYRIVKFCYPEGSTVEQTALVVTKYLTDHPELLNYKSQLLVLAAVRQAWPVVPNSICASWR